MKKLLLIWLFIFPNTIQAQLINLNLSAEPTELSTNFGLGGWYSGQDIGFWADITTDFQSKMSIVEDGIEADIAVELRQTDRVRSNISLKAGPMIPLYKSLWLHAGVSVSFLDEFTEHSNEYWVYRNRETKLAPIAGISLNRFRSLSLSVKYQTTPSAFTVGLGFTFPSQKHPELQ